MQCITRAELPEFARSVLAQVATKCARGAQETAFVLALSGNLGAGKTTFMQALARELGVLGVVQSPTYVLMKSYPLTPTAAGLGTSESRFTTLIHIDAYRLNTPEEFAALKPEAFLHNPQTLVCIEWPEHVAGVLPAPDLTLTFSSELPDGTEAENASDDVRYIEVTERETETQIHERKK